jgi:hypothetical protein
LIAILLLVIAAWWFFNSEIMAVDRCLDAGGRWGENGGCEFAEPGA